MPRRVWKPLRLREMTADERAELTRLARVVERASILLALADGEKPAHIARRLGVARITVYGRLRRFNRVGLRALADEPRSSRPATYNADEKAEVIAAALTKPDDLGLPFGCWKLDRLASYLSEQKGIPIKRSRINELLQAEGLRWRAQETWFGSRVDPEFAKKNLAGNPDWLAAPGSWDLLVRRVVRRSIHRGVRVQPVRIAGLEKKRRSALCLTRVAILTRAAPAAGHAMPMRSLPWSSCRKSAEDIFGSNIATVSIYLDEMSPE